MSQTRFAVEFEQDESRQAIQKQEDYKLILRLARCAIVRLLEWLVLTGLVWFRTGQIRNGIESICRWFPPGQRRTSAFPTTAR